MMQHAIYNIDECSEFYTIIHSQPPKLVRAVVAISVLLLLAGIVWSSYVQANIVVAVPGRIRPLQPPVKVFALPTQTGDLRVRECLVEEGQPVQRGQVLLELDTTRLDHELNQKEMQWKSAKEEASCIHQLLLLSQSLGQATQAQAQAQLDSGQAAHHNAQQRRQSLVKQCESQLLLASERLKRSQALRTSGAISAEELAEIENQVATAREQLAQAALPLDSHQLQVLQLSLQRASTEQALRQADLESRQDAVRRQCERLQREMENLRNEKEHATVRSPVDGIVVAQHIRSGEILAMHQPVYEIADPTGLRFEAHLASTQAGLVAAGATAQLRLDTYDPSTYGTLASRVVSIAPDSVPLLATDQSGSNPANFHLVLEIVDSQFGLGSQRAALRLGLTGTAEIVVQKASLLKILTHKLRGIVRLETL